MKFNKLEVSLAKARENHRFIPKISKKKLHNLSFATKICRGAEEQLMWDPIGFKAGATNKVIQKRFKCKEPFFSYLYDQTSYASGSSIPFQKHLLGAELEVAFKIKNKVFFSDKKITKSNVSKFIIGIAPAIEVVGFRQRINQIDCLGRMISDFGLNVAFVFGKIKKYSLKKISNIQTTLINKKQKKEYTGNTKFVLQHPINSVIWLLNRLKREKKYLSFDFWITSGTTTPIAPIKKGDLFIGSVPKLGSVTTKIS